MKSVERVVHRCLGLELLAQRGGLEDNDEVPAAEREGIRSEWVGRRAELGFDPELLDDERAALDSPVGSLSEEQMLDLDANGLLACILLWCLGRTDHLASPAELLDFEVVVELLDEQGLLAPAASDGINAALQAVTLRTDQELLEASSTYGGVLLEASEATDSDDADEAEEAELVEAIAQMGLLVLRWVQVDEAHWDEEADIQITGIPLDD